MKVLVINSGSSSLKAQLMETDNGNVLAKAYCQRIGLDKAFMDFKTDEKRVINADMPTHKEAFQVFLNALTDKEIGVISNLSEIKAIGHRLVNFGEKYNKSIVVTKKIYEDLKNYIHFAPLHNPAAMLGIQVCMELMPKVKNVAVFDTAFHSTMPEKAYIYAIPYEFYTKNKIRRYGAHGTSHRYIARKCAELFGDLKGKKIISCHLGSGSSICAIKDGKCIDTSMGYTPLAGVVMGTRSGDLDPSVVKEIMDVKGISVDEAINLLNKQSGLIGLTGGLSDMRDIDDNLDKPRIKLAFDVMVYSIKKYIGAYAAAMNGVDYIIFTAGVGENDHLVREAVCEGLEYLGVDFDKKVNETAPRGTIQEFTKKGSKVKVYRIPTDEEYMIALDTAELANK
ncbi:MAG TPA: acetate kinase [Candidatus Onthoplasma faecigallinarum]|nr:acetate kinase [Candidatus Onthoplasma faecigallinarum]